MMIWTSSPDLGISSKCAGSLITISDDGSHVFVAHYMVKEFLTSEKTFAIMNTFYVGGDDDVEAELAKTCLTYLNFEDFSMGYSILTVRS